MCTTLPTNSGEVAGFYYPCFKCDDASGFIWDRQGVLTPFNAAGATSINARGDTTGFTGPYSLRGTGFIRDIHGNVTWFAVPDSCYAQGAAVSINNNGDVTGYYGTCSGYGFGGFVRWSDGGFTVFDGMPIGITEKGDVVGSNYPDAGGALHNFVREKTGKITLFDGGTPVAINNRDDVTGYFADATGTHGFVRAAR